jgi:dTDP-glucose 4,6-dehydratase
VIPAIITQLLAGGGLKLGNLAPTRDLNFVSDTVRGFAEVGLHEKSVGRVTNLGTGGEISIGDLAAQIAGLLGVAPDIALDLQRVRPAGSEVDRLCADASFARSLGWQPQVSLEDGLTETIDWIRRNGNVYETGRYDV